MQETDPQHQHIFMSGLAKKHDCHGCCHGNTSTGTAVLSRVTCCYSNNPKGFSACKFNQRECNKHTHKKNHTHTVCNHISCFSPQKSQVTCSSIFPKSTPCDTALSCHMRLFTHTNTYNDPGDLCRCSQLPASRFTI